MKTGDREKEVVLLNRLKIYLALVTVAISGSLYLPFFFTSTTPPLPKSNSAISWTLTAIIISLALFSLKKRALVMAFGKLSHWYSIHFFLGLIALILLPLHSGFFSGSGISRTMIFLTLFIAANGTFGFTVHLLTPHTLLTLELRSQTFETLKGLQKELEKQIPTLLAGKSQAYTDMYRQIISRRESGLVRLFTTLFSFSGESAPLSATSPTLSMPASKIPGKERSDYLKLTYITSELFSIKEQIRETNFLNRWLLYHICAATILVMLLFLHITSFYYY